MQDLYILNADNPFSFDLQAGVQMLVALIVIAVSLALITPPPSWLGWYIMAFILVFDSAYAWSWGPLVSRPI